MVTADQLVAHLIGDYILQSDWMASEKTKQNLAAFIHACTYTLPFVLISQSPIVLILIMGTHFVIDRWRLARYVVWLKNYISPIGYNPSWAECYLTGYPTSKPQWLSVWLLIIADNTIHIICNGIAIMYF